MAIYIIVLIMIVLSGLSKNQKYYNFLILLLCFLGLFRGVSVGGDVKIYCANIARTNFNPQSWSYYSEFEAGYNILIASYNYLFSNPLFFVGLCTVSFVLSWYVYNQKKVQNPYLGLVFFYMLGYYVQSFNIIRQYFALSLIMPFLIKYDIESLNKRNALILGVLICFVGTFFHNAIYILLLIPLYYFLKIGKKQTKRVYLGLLIFSALIFISGLIKGILGNYSSLYFLNDKSTAYFQSSLLNDTESEYSQLKFFIDNLLLAFLIIKTDKFSIYAYLYIMAQIFVNLFAPLNVLFVRIAAVLSLLGLPYLVKVWVDNNIKTKIMIGVYLCVIFVNLLIKNYGMFEPYKFFFE